MIYIYDDIRNVTSGEVVILLKVLEITLLSGLVAVFLNIIYDAGAQSTASWDPILRLGETVFYGSFRSLKLITSINSETKNRLRS